MSRPTASDAQNVTVNTEATRDCTDRTRLMDGIPRSPGTAPVASSGGVSSGGGAPAAPGGGTPRLRSVHV